MAPKTIGYSSDLTDKQWQLLEPLLGASKKKPGRLVTRGVHGVSNGILDVNKTGYKWIQVPQECRTWLTFYFQFRRKREFGV